VATAMTIELAAAYGSGELTRHFFKVLAKIGGAALATWLASHANEGALLDSLPKLAPGVEVNDEFYSGVVGNFLTRGGTAAWDTVMWFVETLR